MNKTLLKYNKIPFGLFKDSVVAQSVINFSEILWFVFIKSLGLLFFTTFSFVFWMKR